MNCDSTNGDCGFKDTSATDYCSFVEEMGLIEYINTYYEYNDFYYEPFINDNKAFWPSRNYQLAKSKLLKRFSGMRGVMMFRQTPPSNKCFYIKRKKNIHDSESSPTTRQTGV